MLKIIGNHEENTINQAKNCLAHGADKFILCADGHMGYGHPIGGADEAPQCYKKLEEVLAHHADSVQIETRLTPIIVCMAGDTIRDPYKD